MHGTRDAAAAWEREYTRTLETVGFELGVKVQYCTVCIVACGEHFATLGDDDVLREVAHVMSSHYSIKGRAILVAGRSDAEEVRILNRCFALELAFLAGHAGRLMSRSQVGRDGRTAYELHAGEPYRRQLVEFGQRVYIMPYRLEGAKMDPK